MVRGSSVLKIPPFLPIKVPQKHNSDHFQPGASDQPLMLIRISPQELLLPVKVLSLSALE